MFNRKNFLIYGEICIVLFLLGAYSVFIKGTMDIQTQPQALMIFIPLFIGILLILGHLRDKKRGKK